jgi:integrative and conjugative element protein (TIGR02256 family)
MIFRTDKIILMITDDVLYTFGKYIQDTRGKHEAGGILLGQIRDNYVYLVRASIPNSYDKSARFGFQRDKRAAQLIVEHEFANSNGKTIYIGEWHTHPENFPEPSGQDMAMIIGQFKLNKNIEPYIFLAIQGIKELRLWFYDGRQFIKMKKD